ncbi:MULTISPECIES: A24 family peptidase [Marinomonas]|uniref:Prepilin leader peptidase/N-methyltransferase n=1 Tax=Marinomonas alcarazii TaxID=491949 RepID=A0A318VET1_9GAMM|nr:MULTISPECIES: A24 family peptidase [Marinomonas]PYF84925.1 type 4 prepilin peptidase 1 [Marinomonas alcarazii]
MDLTVLMWTLYCVMVLCIGSFSAAYTTRWPIKQDYLWTKEAHHLLSIPFTTSSPLMFNRRRSHCIHCEQPLTYKDLIPIFSFIALKGKCRYCKQRISSRYLVIEITHLLCCLPLLWLFDDVYSLTLITLLMSALITATVIDMEHKLIPDECNTVALGCGLLLNISANNLHNSVLGMMAGFVLLYTLRWLYTLCRDKEGIGLGDAKLLAALGSWLGLSHLPTLLFCASICGILYTVFSKTSSQDYIAFGPFLTISALLVFYLTL